MAGDCSIDSAVDLAVDLAVNLAVGSAVYLAVMRAAFAAISNVGIEFSGGSLMLMLMLIVRIDQWG